MLLTLRKIFTGLFIFAVALPGVQAANWQDQLSAAAGQLTQNKGSGLDAGAISRLLAGGNNSLAAGSMPNVAGVFEYCTKQKLLTTADPQRIKSQLLDKIGLSTPQQQSENPGYQEGLSGLLNTRDGQQLNLNTLSDSDLGKKLKLKACNIILDQGLSFIS